jgi:hypothetical protein
VPTPRLDAEIMLPQRRSRCKQGGLEEMSQGRGFVWWNFVSYDGQPRRFLHDRRLEWGAEKKGGPHHRRSGY